MLKRGSFLIFVVVLLTVGKHAQGACSGSNGTSFNENWQTGSSPYVSGGAATAIQTWTLTNSGQSLTSSPPGTGWNCSTVLEMPPESSTIGLTSIGTMPYIPQNSASASYDLYWEMYWTATNFTGGSVLTLSYPGTGTDAFIMGIAGGTQTEFYLNDATLFVASTATHHLFHLHDVSNSTCEVQVDGGSYTTFTCAAADFNQITLTGQGSGGPTIYIGNVYLSAPGYTVSPWPPSALFDACGGAIGSCVSSGTTATNANLLASTRGGNWGSAKTPNITGSGSDTLTLSSSNACPSFASALTLAGSTWSANSGLILDHHIGASVSPGLVANFTMYSSYPAVAAGFCFGQFSSGTSTQIDAFELTNSFILNVCDSIVSTSCLGTSPFLYHLFCVEDLYNITVAGCVQTSNNTKYWVTVWAQSGTAPVTAGISVYNLNSNGTVGSQVGSTITSSNFGSWSSGQALSFGSVGGAGPTIAVDQIFGNVIFQFAQEAFPVLPPAAAANYNMMPLIIGVNGGFERRIDILAELRP